MPRTTPGAQPTMKSVLQSKEVIERCDHAILKWMTDVSIPFNVANSTYDQCIIDVVASISSSYKGPDFVRGYLLVKNAREINKICRELSCNMGTEWLYNNG